jgi:hypothetical protein
MTHDRLLKVSAQLADARARMLAARRTGDRAGAEYAQAEARRLRAILEGAGA